MRATIIAFALILSLAFLTSVSALEITSSPQITGEVNVEYTYQVDVSTQNNESIQFSLTENPSGMTISSQGLVSWTPTTAGVFNVGINVSNSTNNISQNFQVQVVATPSQISASAIELGGSNQARGETIFFNYEISNTGSYPITGLTAEFANIASRYNAVISLPGSTIAPKSSVVALISVDIPENQESGRQRLGQIVLNGVSENNVNAVSRDVFLTTRTDLGIDQVEIRVDGRRDRLTSSGTFSRDVNIGSEVEVTVRVINNGDLEIDDIDVELFSIDLDDADGQDAFIRRLRPGRTAEVTFTFVIDEFTDLDDSPFDVEIRVDGVDENNVRQSDDFRVTFEARRESRDIRFFNPRVSPENLACNNLRFTFSSDVRNIGLRDLSNSMVRVVIPELNINEIRRNIDLREGESRQVSVNVNLPNEVARGQYIVEVFAHPTTSTADFTDSRVFTVNVPSCDVSPEPQTPTEPQTPPIDVTTDDRVVVTGVPIQTATDETDNYLILLAVLVGILIIIMLILLVKLIN